MMMMMINNNNDRIIYDDNDRINIGRAIPVTWKQSQSLGMINLLRLKKSS